MKHFVILFLSIIQMSFLYGQNENKAIGPNIEDLENQIKQNPASLELNYNLGTLYFQNNDFANARFYLERAHAISPNDSDVNQNITLLRDKIGSDISVLPDFFLSRWWHGFTNLFHPGIWYIIHIAFVFITMGTLFLLLIRKDKINPSKIKPIAYTSLFISLLALFSGRSRQNAIFNSDLAVVAKNALLYAQNDKQSKSLEELKTGVLVHIKNKTGVMVRVELEDKQVGYLEDENLKYLNQQ